MTPKPPKILLVEDEPLIRLLAADMLQMLGYEVLEAATGAEALSIANGQGEVSGALIDLGLPDQSGEEVIRRIHDARPDLRVIVATGSDAQAVALRLQGHGIVGILEKPYQFRDLQRALVPLATAG